MTNRAKTNYVNKSVFVVMQSKAAMPNSCWGRYVRVAVVETDGRPVKEIACISTHSRGVRRVVATWEKCFDGSTMRSASGRAWQAASLMASALNAAI